MPRKNFQKMFKLSRQISTREMWFTWDFKSARNLNFPCSDKAGGSCIRAHNCFWMKLSRFVSWFFQNRITIALSALGHCWQLTTVFPLLIPLPAESLIGHPSRPLHQDQGQPVNQSRSSDQSSTASLILNIHCFLCNQPRLAGLDPFLADLFFWIDQ